MTCFSYPTLLAKPLVLTMGSGQNNDRQEADVLSQNSPTGKFCFHRYMENKGDNIYGFLQ
jgi:hypothetical protein